MEIRDERKSDVIDKVKNSGIVKKLKSIKNIRLIAAIFIIAIALLIYSTVATEKATRSASTDVAASEMDAEESRLASILEGLDGVGRAQPQRLPQNLCARADRGTGLLSYARAGRSLGYRCTRAAQSEIFV